MFDDVLQLVKEHLGNNPEVAQAIPPEQADAIHQEIASHVTNGLQGQAPAAGAGGLFGPGGIGGVSSGSLLSNLENSLASGNILTSAITGGLVASLASKFGLPPAATGAIAAALPGLMQKLTQRS